MHSEIDVIVLAGSNTRDIVQTEISTEIEALTLDKVVIMEGVPGPQACVVIIMHHPQGKHYLVEIGTGQLPKLAATVRQAQELFSAKFRLAKIAKLK